jgi:hypothetical protein
MGEGPAHYEGATLGAGGPGFYQKKKKKKQAEQAMRNKAVSLHSLFFISSHLQGPAQLGFLPSLLLMMSCSMEL